MQRAALKHVYHRQVCTFLQSSLHFSAIKLAESMDALSVQST